MNIFPIFSITVVYFSLLLGFHVSYLNPKNQLNRIFFLFCILISFISLAEVGALLASDIELATFWIGIGALWIFLLPMVLHFVLIYTGNQHIIEERINRVFALLYGPAFIFVTLDMTVSPFSGDPVKTYWGWTKGQSDYTIPFILLVIWALAITVSCIILCIRYYLKLKDERKKKIAKHVILGCWIILFVSIYVEGLLPELRTIVPEFVGLSFILGGSFIGYAIYRYGFLSLAPELATQSIFWTLKDAVVMVSPEGKIEKVNEAASGLFGYHSRELCGKSLKKIFLNTDITDINNALKDKQREGDKIIDTETYVVTKGGGLIPASLAGSLLVDEGGHLHGMTFIAKDLSERKRAEKIIIETRSNYKNLFDSSPESISIIDLEGNILDVNPITTKMFGTKKEDMIGKPILEMDFILPEEVPRYLDLFESLLQDGKHKPFQTEVLQKSGERMWIEVHPSVLRKDDRVYAFQLMSRDITKKKMMEENLLKAKSEAEEANRIKGQFLANISHEIRTPMTAMMGMVNLLDQTELSAEQQEYINIVQASSQSLLEMINNILDLSKITQRKMELESISFDLYYLIEDIIDILGIKAAEKGVDLSMEITPNCPRYVIGDSTRLKQVLINLISNGIKFTEEGEVKILVDVDRVLPNGSCRLHFLVRDTGVGINERKLSSIFDSFTQGDESTARKYGGTGLGLAISKSLVELMGGKIWAKSREMRGSTFHFTVPLGITAKDDDEEVRPESEENILVDMKKQMSILLVEDNIINCKIIQKLLRRIWSSVDVVKNGEEVLGALKKKRYNMVLMDVQVTQRAGPDLIRKIREGMGRSSGIPIIGLTSHAIKGDRERAFESEMDDLISKPIDPGNFYKVIHAHSKYIVSDEPGWEVKEREAQISRQFRERDILDLDEFKTRFKMENESMLDLFKVYIEEHQSRYDEIERAVTEKDYERLSVAANDLKSPSANLSAKAVADLASRLERMSKSKDVSHAREILDSMKKTLKETVKLMGEFIESQPKPTNVKA